MFNFKTKEMNIQIHLENQIISALNEDNSNHNTFHFLWYDTGIDTYLDIVSCNSKNGQQFLLLTQEASTKIECLSAALKRIKDQFPLEYSWKVIWKDTKNTEHVSYFRGVNEETVRSKFHFEGNISCDIVEIIRQPIS